MTAPSAAETVPPVRATDNETGSAPDAELQRIRDLATLRLSERTGRSFNFFFPPLALLSAALILPYAGPWRTGGWLLAYATLLALRQWCRRSGAYDRLTRAGPPLRAATVLGGANAAVLGLLAWLPGDALPLAHQLMLTVLMITVVALVAGICHDFTGMLRAYLLLLLGPFAWVWLHSPHDIGWVVALALLLLAMVLDGSAAQLRRASLERAELEAVNQRLARDLAAQVAALDALNRSKTALLAAASHDLRQPAHAMGMLIDTLIGRPQDNPLPTLYLLQRSNARLVGMLTTLMDLARLDSGSFDVDPQPVSLDAVMEEARLHFQGVADQKGLLLHMQPSGLYAISDPYLLRRMLLNLMGNAVKYTPSGSVTLQAQQQGDGTVRLSVSDTGIGIPPDLQAGVFEEYTRLGRAGEGLGIGLAVVRSACQLLGHEIQLQSTPTHGTRVSLTLQRAPAPPEARPAALSMRPPASHAPLVLVAEDDPEARRGVTLLLQSWGYAVLSAPATEPLLAQVRADGRTPVLLLTDLHLQGCNGFDTARAVRALPRLQALPVLMLTGDLDPAAQRHAQAHDIMLLHKPAPSRRLRDALVRLLRNDSWH